MAEHLLPPQPRAYGAWNSACDGSTAGHAGSYEQLFKEEIYVIDEAGKRWALQYEGVACNQQRHLRLTSGWRDFARAHHLDVGEYCDAHCRRSSFNLPVQQACFLSSL